MKYSTFQALAQAECAIASSSKKIDEVTYSMELLNKLFLFVKEQKGEDTWRNLENWNVEDSLNKNIRKKERSTVMEKYLMLAKEKYSKADVPN